MKIQEEYSRNQIQEECWREILSPFFYNDMELHHVVLLWAVHFQ